MAQRQVEQGQTAVQAKHAQAETAANQQDAARPAGHPFVRLQQAVGNRLAGAVLQAKLKIGQPNDRFEQEADRVADRIMGPSWSPAMLGTNLTRPAGQPRVQRVCRQCQQEFERPEGPQVENLCPSCRANLLQRQPLDEEEAPDELLQRQMVDENEEEEPEEVLQTKANPGQPKAAPTQVARSINGLKGGGRPLPDTTRAFFESRFGRDLGQVRVHTNSQAEQTARDVNARAFTVGSDLVFGPGEYAPETKPGQRLLAHELTHVVQQAAAGPRLQRQANDDAAAAESPQEEAAAPALIVDDEMVTALAPGQMRKSEFLSQLNTAVCATAESALAGTGQTTDGCPYLRFWFDYYRQKSSQHIERAIRRYAPEAGQATTAQEYIPFITERVRQGVEQWAQTGEVTGVPEDMPAAMTAASSGEGDSQPGNVQFKAKSGGARSPVNPRAIQAQLGDGRSLDSSVRSRMESAFGTNFGHVRIHTDSQAASLSNKHNARAFTIGEHVAFGAGEYRPSTLVGDAILAHELAHVLQQKGANAPTSQMPPISSAYDSLEMDADRAATGTLLTLQNGLKEIAGNTSAVLPRLKSGLRLQRCNGDSKEKTPQKQKPPQNKCTLKTPEECATYNDWLATFPTPTSSSADKVINDDMPDDLKDSITGQLNSKGMLPDCADVAFVLRHYYLKAHGKSFSFLVGPTKKGASEFTLGKGATPQEVQACMLGAGTLSFQEERKGFALVSFYKKGGTKTVNLKQLIDLGLKPGDMLVWKRKPNIKGNFQGHVQTIQAVIKPEFDAAGKLTKEGKIIVVQGNMSSGKGTGELQQRQYTFKELTGDDRGNANINDEPKNHEEFLFGAGPWL